MAKKKKYKDVESVTDEELIRQKQAESLKDVIKTDDHNNF